jgi:hypothetical protein
LAVADKKRVVGKAVADGIAERVSLAQRPVRRQRQPEGRHNQRRQDEQPPGEKTGCYSLPDLIFHRWHHYTCLL